MPATRRQPRTTKKAAPAPAPSAVGLRPALDDLDRRLIDQLRLDGRASNRALAEGLGVNEATVGSRLRRLEDNDIVRVVAVTDMEALGHRFLAFGKLTVAGRPLRDVAAELAEIPENIAVVLTVGRFDIILSTLARDRHHLSELVSSTVPSVPGVDAARWELALEVLEFRSELAVLGTEDRPVEPRGATDAVDDLDVQIIEQLQHDARSSNRGIAAELGVSEGTVRTRIKRMEDERVIRIQAISDVSASGIGAVAYVGVQVEGGQVASVADSLALLPGACTVTRSLGDYDLFVVLIAPTRDELLGVVVDEISRLPGVRRTETIETFGTVKHSYTWARIV